MSRSSLCLVLGLLVAMPATRAGDPLRLVACAPGYPGSTEQAQPTMNELAHRVSKLARWSADRLTAIYYDDLDAGLAAFETETPALALVPLPFYLGYRQRLALEPLLAVEPEQAAAERWSLVAASGAVTGPASLAGWELASLAGYNPSFVREVALGDWGRLPDDVEIAFTSRIVGKLRKASRGDPVAVLLDRAQTEALDSLSFAEGLDVVATSPPMVASLLCGVRGRLSEADRDAVRGAFLELSATDPGRETLKSIRVGRFAPLEPERLRAAELAVGALPGP